MKIHDWYLHSKDWILTLTIEYGKYTATLKILDRIGVKRGGYICSVEQLLEELKKDLVEPFEEEDKPELVTWVQDCISHFESRLVLHSELYEESDK